jgi:hypothetical protein
MEVSLRDAMLVSEWLWHVFGVEKSPEEIIVEARDEA